MAGDHCCGPVFPTPVGVFLWRRYRNTTGRPSSPRPWGCFHRRRQRHVRPVVFPTPVGVFPWTPPAARSDLVFPTPVGVFLAKSKDSGRRLGLPHARGGVSEEDRRGRSARTSSPRPWGCFRLGSGLRGQAFVFPTPVGVFPVSNVPTPEKTRLPHARGGVSEELPRTEPDAESSPRPWGCFSSTSENAPVNQVFPTPVGVFLSAMRSKRMRRCLPHARGGVSAAWSAAVPRS